MDPYLRDVLDVLLRMLHVIAGIAWIGASFYFVRLDLALRSPKRQRGRGRRSRRRVLGRARRRPLPLAEVPARARRDAGAAALVQVGGVHDLAVGLRADDRPLLLRRGRPTRRRRRRRPRRVAGDRAQRRRDRARMGRLRRALPHGRAAKPGRARGGRDRARRARGLGRRRALLAARRLPPGRRDARDDHGRERLLRDHPRAPEARRGDGGEARARRRAAPRGEEPVGAQQLPHAARALHDARRPLRVRVRRRRGLARLRRDRGAHGAHPRLLQPLARRAPRVVDPGGRSCRRRRAGVLAAAGGGRLRRHRTGGVRADRSP